MTKRQLVFAIACAAAVRAGAATPVPNTFTAGTPAKAAEVNQNFQAVVDQIAALEASLSAAVTRIATLEGGSTSMDTRVATLEGSSTAMDGRIAAIEGKLPALVPTGTILPFTGTTIPAGFLACDGTAVSRTTYATLFAVIGVSFGNGDQIATFNLPDLRGRFVRGADGGAGHDPDAAARIASGAGGKTGDQIGSLQSSAFASHPHNVTDTGHDHYVSGGGGCGCTQGGADLTTFTQQSEHRTAFNTTGIVIQNAGSSTETRPVNVYVGWIIKT